MRKSKAFERDKEKLRQQELCFFHMCVGDCDISADEDCQTAVLGGREIRGLKELPTTVLGSEKNTGLQSVLRKNPAG